MNIRHFLSLIALFPLHILAQEVRMANPDYIYSSSSIEGMEVIGINFGNDATIVECRPKEGVDTFVVSSKAYIVEDGGIRHELHASGEATIQETTVLHKGKTHALHFAPCVNRNTRCIDFYNGGNGVVFGLHDPSVTIDISDREYKMSEDETNQSVFRPGRIEITGKFPDNRLNGKKIFCQYLHLYTDQDRYDKYASISDGGTFHLSFAADHPGMLSFFSLNEGDNMEEMHDLAWNIYARPGDRLEINFDLDKHKCVEVNNLDGRPDNLRYTNYAYNIIKRVSYEAVQADDLEKGRDDIRKTYEKNKKLARYIIWHDGFSDTEARLYLDDLLFSYTDGMSYVNQKAIERENILREEKNLPFLENLDSLNALVDLSYLKELNPYNEGYLCNTYFMGAYSRTPPVFEQIRKDVYANHKDLSVAEKEVKILHEQSDALNKITGWNGLTNIAQAMYVYQMYKILSSNGFKKLNTTEPLEAIQKELTHPYLINSAKEIYDNYVME